MIETYRGVVYPNELDHMGHMNVQYYTAKFDGASWHLFNEIGITPRYLKDNKRGMAAVEQTFKYKLELFAGDVVHIKSKVLGVKNSSLRLLHIMYNSETGEEVASTEIIPVHMDKVNNKSCPIPLEIREKIKNL